MQDVSKPTDWHGLLRQGAAGYAGVCSRRPPTSAVNRSTACSPRMPALARVCLRRSSTWTAGR